MCLPSGNTLVIATVAATKVFHTLGSALIVNLAVSDLLVGVGVMPWVAASVVNCAWADSTVRPQRSLAAVSPVLALS